MPRTDYAFPFRIDQGSRQGGQSPYAQHVDDMIRQILLTTPGERAGEQQDGQGVPGFQLLLFQCGKGGRNCRPVGAFLGQVDFPRILEAEISGATWVITTNPVREGADRARVFEANLNM
jgi:hypothetical protein